MVEAHLHSGAHSSLQVPLHSAFYACQARRAHASCLVMHMCSCTLHHILGLPACAGSSCGSATRAST